jgi:Na+/glutamate symporter
VLGFYEIAAGRVFIRKSKLLSQLMIPASTITGPVRKFATGMATINQDLLSGWFGVLSVAFFYKLFIKFSTILQK